MELNKTIRKFPYDDQQGYEEASQKAAKTLTELKQSGREVTLEEGQFVIEIVEPRFPIKEKK